MKLRNCFLFTIVICLAFSAISCKNANKERLIKSFETLRAATYFPKEVGPSLFLDDMTLDDKDMVITYTYSTTPFLGESSIKNLQNSKGVARYVASVGESTVQELADCGVSIRLVYKTSDGNFEHLIPNAELKEILAKLKNGEIEPATFLEITRDEFANTAFPVQIDEYTWLTGGWVNGNEIVYQYTLSDEISPEIFTAQVKETLRQDMIASLKPTVISNMVDFQRDHIVLKFHYFDTSDNELLSFTFTGNDFLQ